MEMNRTEIKRGDIFLYNFGEGNGSIQGGIRAAVVVSNNIANRYSPVVLVSPITSQINNKATLPTHVVVDHESCGLLKESQILCEQIFSVNKNSLHKFIGSLDDNDMEKLNKALEVSVEVGEAGEKLKGRGIKMLKEKVEMIKELDSLIKNWINKGKSIELIYEFIEERNARIEDMKNYCEKIGVNYENYYCDKITNKRKAV